MGMYFTILRIIAKGFQEIQGGSDTKAESTHPPNISLAYEHVDLLWIRPTAGARPPEQKQNWD